MKDKADIIFLQETYSTPEVENVWKSQWRGELFFSHGSEHSRGVLTLVKEGLDCQLKVCKQDELGRYVVQGQPFIFANIYAPNKVNEQCVFYDEIRNELAEVEADADHRIIIGSDFNVILDPDLDGSGGKPKLKESCKKIENLCSSFDLIDIWRIRNPGTKRFSWRQKNPTIQRHLDYWLIANSIQEEVERVDIIPDIRSDHSAITLYINGIENTTYGPSFWKFNASLLEDKEYMNKINQKSWEWIEENREIQDPRVLCDTKYKIRYETIVYSKKKAKERRSVLVSLEERLKECQVKCDEDPTPENLNNLEITQTE